MPILKALKSEIVDHSKKSMSYELRTKNWRQRRLGFTLIELLVVISIIAILITIIVATFGTTQAKARDNRRKTDLDALKKALELHKSDTPGSAWYPDCSGIIGSGGECLLSARNSFSPELNPLYLKDFPRDLSGIHDYVYNARPVPTATCQTLSNGDRGCSDYTITACLENPNDADAKPKPASGLANDCPEDAVYVIQNP